MLGQMGKVYLETAPLARPPRQIHTMQHCEKKKQKGQGQKKGKNNEKIQREEARLHALIF